MANTKIYLGNLSQSCDKNILNLHFSQFGEITEILLPTDNQSNEIKGYAFVSFKDEASALKAIDQLNGKLFLEQALTAEMATEKKRGKDKS